MEIQIDHVNGMVYSYYKDAIGFKIYHTEDDTPAVYTDGKGPSKKFTWYKHGKIHRDHDKPAKIQQNIDVETEMWYKNGFLHRTVGPAYIDHINEIYMWYKKGHSITHQVTDWCKEMGIDFYNLSEEDNILIALKWFST